MAIWRWLAKKEESNKQEWCIPVTSVLRRQDRILNHGRGLWISSWHHWSPQLLIASVQKQVLLYVLFSEFIMFSRASFIGDSTLTCQKCAFRTKEGCNLLRQGRILNRVRGFWISSWAVGLLSCWSRVFRNRVLVYVFVVEVHYIFTYNINRPKVTGGYCFIATERPNIEPCLSSLDFFVRNEPVLSCQSRVVHEEWTLLIIWSKKWTMFSPFPVRFWLAKCESDTAKGLFHLLMTSTLLPQDRDLNNVRTILDFVMGLPTGILNCRLWVV